MNAPVAQPQPNEKLRIFVASPSDVDPERQAVIEILETLQHNYDFEIYGWENTVPQFGIPQQAIDKQIPSSDCQIVVVILWCRLGTPTGLKRPDGSPYLSGTQYEVERAIEAYRRNQNGLPRIMIYQKTDDPWSVIKQDAESIIQYGRLLDYLKKFQPSGEHPAWIYPFVNNDFKNIFRDHICRVLDDLNNRSEAYQVSERNSSKNWAEKVGIAGISLKQDDTNSNSYLSNDDLRDQIEFWMISISDDKRAPYRSIGQLCDSADGLAYRIDDEIVELAQSNPSNACWLVERLFQIHCDDDSPPRLIRPISWQRVRFEWETQTRRSASPSTRMNFRIESQRIYFGERSLVLTRRCHDLLRRLLETRGDVCTYDDLIRVGWPMDDPNGVNVKAIQEAMRRLRNDLKKKYRIDANWWIETIYGQGYRLRLPDELDNQTDASKKGVSHVY